MAVTVLGMQAIRGGRNNMIVKLIACLLLALVCSLARADDLQPFDASYVVNWKGMTAGRGSLTLRRTGPGLWTYDSRSSARGIFRLVISGTITQHSELQIVDDKVRPLRYKGDDGTAATKRDIDVTYDWPAQRVRGTYEDVAIDLALEPDTLDDLTVQVALMHELIRGRNPNGFRLLDRNTIKHYDYTMEGTEVLETALGRRSAVIFRSRKSGSKSSTMFWCAPDMGYLPLKVERHGSGDKIEWSMSIESVERNQIAAP